MADARYERFADLLVDHCTGVQGGDTVLIDAQDTPEDMVIAVVNRVVEANAVPLVDLVSERVRRAQIINATEKSMKRIGEIELENEWAQFDIPNFVLKEVTGEIRYYNSMLQQQPYKNWTDIS